MVRLKSWIQLFFIDSSLSKGKGKEVVTVLLLERVRRVWGRRKPWWDLAEPVLSFTEKTHLSERERERDRVLWSVVGFNFYGGRFQMSDPNAM